MNSVTDMTHPILIHPANTLAHGVLKQFISAASAWRESYTVLKTDWPEAIDVLHGVIEHIGPDLVVSDNGLLLHCVLRNAMETYHQSLGGGNDIHRLMQFLRGLEDGLTNIPGFEIHAPNLSPWRLDSLPAFQTWRGDIAPFLLSVRNSAPLDAERAVSMIRRLQGAKLYKLIAECER